MKFKIIAREGYIIIATDRRKCFVGVEFKSEVMKAFKVAERLKNDKGVVIYDMEVK